MEVKINREIRNYTETVYFGLTLRQFVFSLLAAATAVALWLALRQHTSTETLSWICILGAGPFAAAGFVTYHAMPAERALWEILRSEVLEPKKLPCRPANLYYEAMRRRIGEREKEERKKHD